jgi:hypothetical protein
MGGSRRDLLGAARYRRYPGHTWRSHGAARRRVWLVERFAVAINIALFGLIGPFAASLMERVGLQRIVLSALALLATSVGLTTQIVVFEIICPILVGDMCHNA